MEVEMRRFALGGLVTLAMFMFAALAQAEGPVFHIIDGRCGVFDAVGYIWEVEGLHVTSSTDPDGNTHLSCNATLPEAATASSGKPVVWDAWAYVEGRLPDPLLVPEGAFNAIPDPVDGLIYCAVAGAGRTTDWTNLVNKGGRSNASCSFRTD
jgi:hypothetical protein